MRYGGSADSPALDMTCPDRCSVLDSGLKDMRPSSGTVLFPDEVNYQRMMMALR
jgi:hypothetical protein